ncbi:hypothetical protein ACFE04_023871 [Oxalis oulophora]
MTTPTGEEKTRKEILSIFREDEQMIDNDSLLCYCDVPALVLTSKEANNHKRSLATCSKYNQLGFRCNMWEWFYNDTAEPQCKILLQMRRDTYKLRLNHGPIRLSEYKGKLYNGYPLCFCGQFCKTAYVREGPLAGKKIYACVYYDEVSDVGRCKLRVWLYPSNDMEEVPTYTMDTYKTWDEEKIAHKSARDRLHYLEYLSKKLMGIRDDLKFSILPTKTVGMRTRRGRPPLKRMVASRSTWTDKNWSGEGDVIFEDDVILEGVPVSKMTKLGL